MKTIFKSTILLAVAGLSLFTSCKDDRDSNPTLTQPTTFVLNELSVNGNIDLEKTTAPIVLTWSQPTPYNGFNAPVVPTYWVEMSPIGQFTTPFDANADDNSGADYFVLDETFSNGSNVEINAQNLNRTMLQMLSWTEATTPAIQQLSVRVKAAIRDASFKEYHPIYSNVITINTVPYYMVLKPADPEIWHLIGGDIADGSWGDDIGTKLIPMQTIEDCVYDSKTGAGIITWTGYIAGKGFKLKRTPGNWDFQWGQGDAFGKFAYKDGGSGNITVDEPGYYTITLNTGKAAKLEDKEVVDNATDNDLKDPDKDKAVLQIKKYDATPAEYASITICGSWTDDWSDEIAMNPSFTFDGAKNHDWYLVHEFAAGIKFKLKEAGSWDYNSGGTFVSNSDGFYGYGVQGGSDFIIEEGGKYLILYNDITRYFRLIKQ